eukprot:1469372-Rhodomonas_salina.1
MQLLCLHDASASRAPAAFHTTDVGLMLAVIRRSSTMKIRCLTGSQFTISMHAVLRRWSAVASTVEPVPGPSSRCP